MELSTLLFLAGSLACPIVMGLMMWMMSRNMGGQSDHSSSDQHQPVFGADRLATLHAQQRDLVAEIAEVTRLAELEAQRDALLNNRTLSPSKANAATVQSVD